MSETPADLKYTKSHEWVRDAGDGIVTMGITDHAQAALGDLVFVEVPEVGRKLSAGDACAVVESVKAASDVYCPVSGEVVEANEQLTDAPEKVNDAPYGDGWLVKIRLDDDSGMDALLDPADYAATLDE